MQNDLFQWGAWDEIERRIRIRLSVWAYAYEIAGTALVDDATYDALAYKSRPHIITGRFDDWWRTFYTPYSGAWIYTHPDLNGIAKLYSRLK